ncbi:MAG: hypothetical protein JRI66_12915 [Deltaproteobacteria bacterium]|nr:hypothetical protein [Deltaproteobacteria bacterium]
MKYSLHEFLKAVVGIATASHAAGTVNGPAIDRVGFEEALVVVHSGTNGAGGTVDIKVQESDDNSTWADISGAAFDQITEANDNDIYVGRINLKPRKKYIRVVATVGTAACVFGAVIVLGAAIDLPVSQVNDVAFSV